MGWHNRFKLNETNYCEILAPRHTAPIIIIIYNSLVLPERTHTDFRQVLVCIGFSCASDKLRCTSHLKSKYFVILQDEGKQRAHTDVTTDETRELIFVNIVNLFVLLKPSTCIGHKGQNLPAMPRRTRRLIDRESLPFLKDGPKP